MAEVVSNNSRRDAASVKKADEFDIVQGGLRAAVTAEQIAAFVNPSGDEAGVKYVKVGQLAIAFGTVTDATAAARSASFPTGLFSAAPVVNVTAVNGSTEATATVNSTTSTGATATTYASTGAVSGDPFNWIAIGPAA